MQNKPVVAHLSRVFFERSTTFIYNNISNLKKYHPICLAWSFENLDQFPFPTNDIYSLATKRFTMKWLQYGIPRKLLRRDLIAEKVLKRRKAELIHAHFGRFGVYALSMKKSLGIPLVTNFYGIDMSKWARNPEIMEDYEILFREGDLFLVEGAYMKEQIVKLGCPEEKARIQRIAIPINRIKYKRRDPKKKNEKVILMFSGRIVEKKGLITALMAMNHIRRTFKNFEFRIIGDGPQRSEMVDFIHNHEMDEYVRLLGFLKYDDYLEEMGKADIFVHPSVTASDGDSEGGAPTTILEAQAMGMPVISSLHADIPNVVVQGNSALLSREGDYRALSESLSLLIENQHRWPEMGKTGREFVEEYHDIENEIELMEETYDSML